MRSAVLVLLLAAVLAPVAAAATQFGRGTATITTRTGKVVLRVELARSPAERQTGLMGRGSLAARAGMVFLYPHGATGGFWMKDTTIPLDIAFSDAGGRILRIFHMTPCKRDPCVIYDPGVAYRAALEVNAGSFRRWNVRRGDRIAVRATPAR